MREIDIGFHHTIFIIPIKEQIGIELGAWRPFLWLNTAINFSAKTYIQKNSSKTYYLHIYQSIFDVI